MRKEEDSNYQHSIMATTSGRPTLQITDFEDYEGEGSSNKKFNDAFDGSGDEYDENNNNSNADGSSMKRRRNRKDPLIEDEEDNLI